MKDEFIEPKTEGVAIDVRALRAENAKLSAALERLIKDYEDETGERAMAARAALNEKTK